MFDDPVGRLRLLGIAEGVSFLLLLFIAMPLKYFFAFPVAVTVLGLVHGLLFILFCFYLFIGVLNMQLKLKTNLQVYC